MTRIFLADIPQVAGYIGKASCSNPLWQRFWR
jgi:hypothetical protein